MDNSKDYIYCALSLAASIVYFVLLLIPCGADIETTIATIKFLVTAGQIAILVGFVLTTKKRDRLEKNSDLQKNSDLHSEIRHLRKTLAYEEQQKDFMQKEIERLEMERCHLMDQICILNMYRQNEGKVREKGSREEIEL